MPGKHQLTAFQEAVSWSLMASGRSSGSRQMRLSPGQQGAHSPAGETHYPRGSETSPCPLGRASSKAGLWVPCPQSVCFRRSQVGPEVLHVDQDRRCCCSLGHTWRTAGLKDGEHGPPGHVENTPKTALLKEQGTEEELPVERGADARRGAGGQSGPGAQLATARRGSACTQLRSGDLLVGRGGSKMLGG